MLISYVIIYLNKKNKLLIWQNKFLLMFFLTKKFNKNGRR